MCRLHDERGIALIVVVMVSFIAVMLGTVVVVLSAHNSQSSGMDRKRVQSIGAAEAGLNYLFSYLQTATVGAMTCSATQTLGTSPLQSSFTATMTLYDSSDTVMACPPPAGQVPASAIIDSVGSVNNSTPRQMQAKVDLHALYGTINFAIFSNNSVSLVNSLDVNGYQANDANIYTNGSFTLTNSGELAGSVYAQGEATLNSSGVIAQDVWSNGALTMGNTSTVHGNATSSTSSITLNNSARIDGNGRAGTTISPASPNIGGLKIQNSPQGAPPAIALPQITYNASDWTSAGYTVQTFSTCAAAKTFIAAIASGNYAIRINSVCNLSYSGETLSIRGNLAIITDGGFLTSNNTAFNGIGGTWNMFIIDVYRAGLTCSSGSYNITSSNHTTWNSLYIFAYTPCTIDFGNNNSGGVPGQLIGGTVNIANNMTFNYRPLIVPGAAVTGFNQDIRYLREVRVG